MSFDDLLGDEESPRNLGGRPKGSKTVNRRTSLPISLKTGDVHTVTTGVSIPWLARVFRMGRAKIEEALHECKPLRTTQNGGAIYDLPTAAAFLVAPKTNLDAYLRTIKPNQLPEHLRGGYWDAKTKEAKFRVMAGDLWPTEAIIETLGETFKTLKSTIQLWADTIEETKGLTDDQRALLSEMTDRLMDEMRTALVEQAKNNMTESWLSNIDDAPQEG